MKLKFAIAAAFLAGASLSTGAEAAVNITSVAVDSVGSTTGVISYSGPLGNKSVNVYIGRLRLTGTDNGSPVSFGAYCVDIFDQLQAGLFDVALFNTLGQPKLDQLLAIISHEDPKLQDALTPNKADISAAIQLAVWEIFYETSDSYDTVNPFGTGNFTASPASLAAKELAATYLANINGPTPAWGPAPGYQLNTLIPQSEPNQQQIYLIASPVPEPATWAMMIAGFGLVGGTLRRQRRRMAPA